MSNALAPFAVDAREAGRLLGLHSETVSRMARRGEIPHLRAGRAVRYPVALLQEWLIRQSQASTTVSES